MKKDHRAYFLFFLMLIKRWEYAHWLYFYLISFYLMLTRHEEVSIRKLLLLIFSLVNYLWKMTIELIFCSFSCSLNHENMHTNYTFISFSRSLNLKEKATPLSWLHPLMYAKPWRVVCQIYAYLFFRLGELFTKKEHGILLKFFSNSVILKRSSSIHLF